MAAPQLTATLLFAERENTGDAVFIIDSKRILAHRNVLAAFSPKYKAQFYGPQPEKGDIHIRDISANAFEEFIKFFYGETVNFTIENVESILDQAKQCLMNLLVYECELFLMRSLTGENLLWNYRLSLLYELETLLKVCVERIRMNVQKIFACEDFLRCDQNVLIHILSIEPLVDCKETDLFEGCMSWARAACRRKNINDKNPKNLRAQLNNVLDCICFGSFNIYKFVEINETYKGFFTPIEFIEIVNIIGDLRNFRSKHFNQRIRKRFAIDENATQQNDTSTESGSPSDSGEPKRKYPHLIVKRNGINYFEVST